MSSRTVSANSAFSLVRVGAEARHARTAPRAPAGGQVGQDQRHLAVVVDLGQRGRGLVGEFLDRREEAQPHVLGRELVEGRDQHRLVLGPDRAQQQSAAAGELDLVLELLGIGPDREPALRRRRRGATRMRASSAITPSWSASSGLMSSSAISARSIDQLRELDQRRARSRRDPPAAGRGSPAAAWSTRVCAIRSWARRMLSGGRASARSATISTAVPPWPNRITGPNCGSSDAPTISSCAFGRRIIGCTVKPSIRAWGRCRRRRARSIASAAARTWPAVGKVERDAADVGLVRDVAARGS